MVTRSLILAALSVMAAGCGGPPETSCRASEIVTGQVATGSPAVVALSADGRPFCTGTLIAPRVVVTAAHCLPPNLMFPADPITILFGNDTSAPDAAIDVVDSMAHPEWTVDTVPNDIGVAALAETAPVPPVPMMRSPITADLLNRDVHVLGFGITAVGEMDAGTKREGTTRLSSFDDFTIYLEPNPSGTCFGDSGGPSLLDVAGTELLAAVHSRSDCEAAFFEERIDVHVADFIEPFIATTATCAMDGLCGSGCESPDSDCPCADDGFCTVACADPAMDPDCPAGCGDDGECVEECPADPDCDC